MKPAESGCPSRRVALVPNDALALAAAAQANDDLALVNPFRFRAPLAPAVAAKREGKTIDMRRIVGAFRKLDNRHRFMIVEGAGGIMVPLTPRRSFLDLAVLLGLPVLIVARPSLGTINHTLLTVMALRQRKLTIAGIVINYSRNLCAGASERTSPAVIEQRSGVRVIGIVRHGQKDLSALSRHLLGT
jgi:dethiobiotin synthetase